MPYFNAAEWRELFAFTINAFFERSLELLTQSKTPKAFLINKQWSLRPPPS